MGGKYVITVSWPPRVVTRKPVDTTQDNIDILATVEDKVERIPHHRRRWCSNPSCYCTGCVRGILSESEWRLWYKYHRDDPMPTLDEQLKAFFTGGKNGSSEEIRERGDISDTREIGDQD